MPTEMKAFTKMFARPELRDLPRIIPTSEWTGHLGALIAAKIAESGLDDLKEMAAFINKADNRPGLCGDRNSTLPDLTEDPDVLVYCYIKDVPTFSKNAATIKRLLELSANSAKILAEATGDTSLLSQPDESILQSPMVDQIAFSVACELEQRVQQLRV